MWRNAVLTHAGIVCDIAGVSEFGEYQLVSSGLLCFVTIDVRQ